MLDRTQVTECNDTRSMQILYARVLNDSNRPVAASARAPEKTLHLGAGCGIFSCGGEKNDNMTIVREKGKRYLIRCRHLSVYERS